MNQEKELCAKLLEGFKIAEKVDLEELRDFRGGKSQLYALGPIYIFNYRSKRYYIVDDYSLGDDPELVKNILLESKHALKGNIIKSPVHFTAEGSDYIYGLGNNQYYLWEESRT